MRYASFLLFFGCASTQGPRLHTASVATPSGTPQLSSAPAAATPSEIPNEPLARCAPPANDVTLPPFHAPVADAAFRQALASGGETLRCCDPSHSLEGYRLVVDLVPESLDTARAVLADASDELDPALEACVRAHLATWVMRPAATSDVLRPRLSPFGPRYASSPASVRIALPL